MGDKESCFKVLVPCLIMLGWPYDILLNLSLSPRAFPSRKDMTLSQFKLSTSHMLNKYLFSFLPQCWDLRKYPYRAARCTFHESSRRKLSTQPIWLLWNPTNHSFPGQGSLTHGGCSPLLPWEQAANFMAGQVLPRYSVTCFYLATSWLSENSTCYLSLNL